MPKYAQSADGSAGARRAAAVLAVSLCAESATATMEEDGAKVDLKFSFRDAFDRSALMTSHCQVKSGASYRGSATTPETLTLGVDRATVEALRRGGSPSLIAWVPPRPSQRVYWHIVDQRDPLRTPVRIPRLHHVTPALRFHLTRAARHASYTTRAKRLDVAVHAPASAHARARAAYRSLQHDELEHPLFGTLAVTRYAWRHVTRRSKSATRRSSSLRIVPYLRHFLVAVPDRYDIGLPTVTADGSHTTEVRFIACWYRRALRVDDVPNTLLVRVREEIRYPNRWDRFPLGVRDVAYSARLASWWCKPQK